MGRTTVVIATRDRPDELVRTLDRLRADHPGTPVVVIDNASSDPVAPYVQQACADVEVVRLETNRGAAGRTVGVRRARTEFVAFCDDDSGWQPGAFELAERTFDACPPVAVLVARTLVGAARRPDGTTDALAHSPLRTAATLPGPRVLGFLACAAVLRRTAYLGVGGFDPFLHFAGEERLLAWDLAAHGWQLCYLDALVAHHFPSNRRPPPEWRRRRELRNDALTVWMRRPLRTAARSSAVLARRALSDRAARGAVADLVRSLPGALTRRRTLPAPLEFDVRRLEAARAPTAGEPSP